MSNTNKPIADFDALQKVKAPDIAVDRIGQGSWPDRSGVVQPKKVDIQISIKGDARVIERFKDLCASDRRTYTEMLAILMDNFDKP